MKRYQADYDKFLTSPSPLTGAEFLKAIQPILTPHQMELIEALLMNPPAQMPGQPAMGAAPGGMPAAPSMGAPSPEAAPGGPPTKSTTAPKPSE